MLKSFTRFAMLVVASLVGMTAMADNPFPTDGSAITSGTVYDVQMFGEYYATFTPAVSGTLIQNGCPELKLDKGEPVFLGFTDMGQRYSWEVKGGRTYTIKNDVFVMSSGQVMFVMESDMQLEATSILPRPGSVLMANANMSGEVSLMFNTGVEYDYAQLCAGNDRIDLPNNSIYGSEVGLGITAAMNTLYANGTFSREGGEHLTIEFGGLRSTSGMLYNGDGVLKIDYIAGPKLTDMISNNVPSYLKSYYPEGDPEGIWTLVFDRDLVNDGSIYMSINCGNPMSDDLYYNETVMPKVDGATLTFDMTGKKRELDDYLMMQDSPYVAVKVNNVHDTEGNFAAGQGQGNVGSYPFSLAYDYIKPQTVVCEFDPPTGSSLEGVDEIEIWFNNADMIKFDGVQFNYNDGNGFKNAIVLNSELSKTLDNNEMTIRVKIPAEVKGHDQITVSLYNQQALDGNTYNITAQYDMFVVSLLAPIKPGQAIASTGYDDFVFAINQTLKYFYLRYDFYNAAGDDGWVYGSELTQQANGTWTAYNGDFICYSDFNPVMKVRAYYNKNDFDFGFPPAETYEFTFVGTTEPFAFSSVHFVSIDPEANAQIDPVEDFCFTVTYDGLVKIDTDLSGIMLGMGMGVAPFERVEPVYGEAEPTVGLAPVWKLYPPQWILESESFMDISIFSKDEAGNVVEGNMGAGMMDCLQFSYSIKNSSNLRPLIVIPANGETVDVLDSFTFSYEGLAVGINYNYDDDVPVRLLDENWSIVREFTADDFELVSYGEEITALRVKFDPVPAGKYTLFVPENFIIIGNQFMTYGNESAWLDYTVTASSSIQSILGDKSEVEIYNLQGMRVNPATLTTGIYIIGGKKVFIRK